MKKLILAKISCIAVLLLSNAQLGKSHVYYERTFGGSVGFDPPPWGSYLNSTWTETVYGSFVRVTGTSSGSAGLSLFPGFDATTAPVTPIRFVIRARLGPNHTAGMPVRLGIGDGTESQAWNIQSQLNNMSFTTVTVKLSDTPSWTSGGTLNTNNLQYYQVQGDYWTGGTFELDIEYMAVIPEPHQVAVASLLLLGLGAVVVRRKLASRNNPVLA